MPQFFATCATSLEYLLVDELKLLGAKNVKEGLSVVNFEADWTVAYNILMWSRIASRVLYPIAKFEAKEEQTLYDQASIIDWSQHLTSTSSFLVNSQSFRSELRHTKFISQRIKDSIVDHFTDMEEQRPDVQFEKPDVAIQCKIRQNQVILSIDLAGEGLHKRGYRLQGASAPIKENLAAALLTRAGWLKKCTDNTAKELALYDPMCGSGTFLVEAAMIALQIAPGLNRSYLGLFGWNQFNQALWSETIEKAIEIGGKRKSYLAENSIRLILHGSDINPKAISSAHNNISQAKLEDWIQVQIAGIDQISQMDMPIKGTLIVNPPYSERLGEFEQVKALYTQLGKVLKANFIGWSASVLSPNKEFGHSLLIRANKIYKFNNGSLACELLNFDLQERHFITLRTEQLSAENFRENLSESGKQLCNRLDKNRAKLKKYLNKNEISCYRIYDADLPEYNAAIDVYHDQLHIQEYKAPKSIDEKIAIRRIKEIQRVAAGVFELPLSQVFVKQRRQQKGDWQYKVKRAGDYDEVDKKIYSTVLESGIKFKINLSDYLDTGLFLDHRKTRQLVSSMSKGKRFLNLFCYTGAFSVYAARSGAVQTTNVDLSNTYLAWAKDNFELNGIDGDTHEFIRDDSLVWLSDAAAASKQFDLIFIDPPTFSNSKKMDKHFDIQEDHKNLIEKAIQLLTKNGILIFSNNFTQFKMKYLSSEKIKVTEITKQTTSQDFFRKPLHRCWKIEKS